METLSCVIGLFGFFVVPVGIGIWIYRAIRKKDKKWMGWGMALSGVILFVAGIAVKPENLSEESIETTATPRVALVQTTSTPVPTVTRRPSPTQTPATGPTPKPTLALTPTSAHYHIPAALVGEEYGLIETDWHVGLPNRVQAPVGETVFTTIDGTRVKMRLRHVPYVVADRKWRKFVTTFEFLNPSDNTLTIASEDFFDAWGNYGNWRGAVVVLNTEADYNIYPGFTEFDLLWTTDADDNRVVWVVINSETGTQSVTLNEDSVIYRIDFPPHPTETATPTRTPVN